MLVFICNFEKLILFSFKCEQQGYLRSLKHLPGQGCRKLRLMYFILLRNMAQVWPQFKEVGTKKKSKWPKLVAKEKIIPRVNPASYKRLNRICRL